MFTAPLSRQDFLAYSNSMVSLLDDVYANGRYDEGEAFMDTIGNGRYDPGESFTDANGNGVWDAGSPFVDRNGNGVYLYAENDFVDNNLNTAEQSFISVFGNMTAGNQVRLNRDVDGGRRRTRLDVTLDDRILRGALADGALIVPGLPYPASGQRRQTVPVPRWSVARGSWSSWSILQ